MSEITKRSSDREKQQKLIDIMFEVVMRMHAGNINFDSRERAGKYIADQLRQCGFDTEPMGMSWGVLK